MILGCKFSQILYDYNNILMCSLYPTIKIYFSGFISKNMLDKLKLLDFLSNGDFHSGEDIASEFNVTRTAIWKQLKKLNEVLPSDIVSVSGKGYRLQEPMNVLNVDKINAGIADLLRTEIHKTEVLLECESTNQYLLDGIEQHLSENYLLFAERQKNGRGRRGRPWISPFASNIYMSLSWGLKLSIAEMSGLSLVVAISVANALKKNGIENVKLKWPNDVYVDGKKISGVLLELRGETNSPCRAVIGIGLNVNMHKSAVKKIDQPWTDMQSILGVSVDRNKIAASIVNELLVDLKLFEENGFAYFVEQWRVYDMLEGQQIDITGHTMIKNGIARGVDSQGALLVESDNNISPIYSGEVSIRLK